MPPTTGVKSLLSALVLSLIFSRSSSAGEDLIEWSHDTFEKTLAKGKAEGKNVLIYFWVGGSPQCVRMYEDTLKTEKSAEATRPFVCFSARRGDPGVDPLFGRYKIVDAPAFRVVDPQGELIDGRNGFYNVPVFSKVLENIAAGKDTLVDLRARTTQSPNDLDLQFDLGRKFQSLGSPEEYERIVNEIRERDPGGTTSAGAQLHLDDAISAATDGFNRPDQIAVEPLYQLAETIVPPDVQYRCWDAIAGFENLRGNLKAQFSAYQKALPHVPDGSIYNWGYNAALEIWANRDVATKAEKKIALEIARKTAAVSEAFSEEDPDYYDPAIFLTRRLDVLARCLYMNGKKKDAIATAARSVKLSDYDVYANRLAAYQAGSDDKVFSAYNDMEPVWSPDGKKVLFASDRHGDVDLYLADVLKGSVKRITRFASNEVAGTFSPNGREVAMTSGRMGPPSILLQKVKGKGDRFLIPPDPSSPTPRVRPAFGPKGRQIVYITADGDRPILAVARTDGSEEIHIERTHPDPEVTPTWLGTRILFTSTATGKGDLALVDPKTGNVQVLTPELDQTREIDPTVSPDGSRIVFALVRAGVTRIHAIDIDGDNSVELTNTQYEDRHPSISPDGRRIAFSRRFPDGRFYLWLMDADGSNTQALLSPY